MNKNKRSDDDEAIDIQWFPGHMAKTRRLMKEYLPLVDIVVELLDARIPKSSANPEINKLIGNKPRITLLNKSDSADDKKTQLWIKHFTENKIPAIPTDCKTGNGLSKFLPAIREILAELLAGRSEKGMHGRAIRMMIVGVPNCGKSSLINRLSGNKKTKVEDRPGVTRGNQWIILPNRIDLLDTPGILWPKFEDKSVGEKLAMTGAVRDKVFDIESLSLNLIGRIKPEYSHMLEKRYGIPITQEHSNLDILERIGRKRGMIAHGGEIDYLRTAVMLVDEFRSAKIGKITLDNPSESQNQNQNQNQH